MRWHERGAKLSRNFKARLQHQRMLLVEQGDLSSREIDAEIETALARFRDWLPGELQRMRRE